MSYVIDFSDNEMEKWIGGNKTSPYLIHLKANSEFINEGKEYVLKSDINIKSDKSKFGTKSFYTNNMIHFRFFKDLLSNNDNFTMCLWLYISKLSEYNYTFIVGGYNISARDRNNQSYKSTIILQQSPYPRVITHQNGISGNTWSHLAIVKNNGYVNLYVNGVKSSSSYKMDFITDNILNKVYLGNSVTDSAWSLTAYLDDVCIIKGKALWTSNFTPPTTYLPDDLDSI